MSTKLLSVAVGILFAFVILESIYISGQLHSIHSTLCQERADLQKRYDAGRKQYNRAQAYIDSDTNGKVFGIPTTVLKQGQKVQRTLLLAQKSTLNAQAGLNCSS